MTNKWGKFERKLDCLEDRFGAVFNLSCIFFYFVSWMGLQRRVCMDSCKEHHDNFFFLKLWGKRSRFRYQMEHCFIYLLFRLKRLYVSRLSWISIGVKVASESFCNFSFIDTFYYCRYKQLRLHPRLPLHLLILLFFHFCW